ncbi:hypothetical protein RI367_005731 [Sorochytrium milnesiophthora]
MHSLLLFLALGAVTAAATTEQHWTRSTLPVHLPALQQQFTSVSARLSPVGNGGAKSSLAYIAGPRQKFMLTFEVDTTHPDPTQHHITCHVKRPGPPPGSSAHSHTGKPKSVKQLDTVIQESVPLHELPGYNNGRGRLNISIKAESVNRFGRRTRMEAHWERPHGGPEPAGRALCVGAMWPPFDPASIQHTVEMSSTIFRISRDDSEVGAEFGEVAATFSGGTVVPLSQGTVDVGKCASDSSVRSVAPSHQTCVSLPNATYRLVYQPTADSTPPDSTITKSATSSNTVPPGIPRKERRVRFAAKVRDEDGNESDTKSDDIHRGPRRPLRRPGVA